MAPSQQNQEKEKVATTPFHRSRREKRDPFRKEGRIFCVVAYVVKQDNLMPRQEKYIICSAAAAAAAAAAVVAAALSFFQASRKTEREACRPLREGGRQGGGVGVGVSGTILLALPSSSSSLKFCLT